MGELIVEQIFIFVDVFPLKKSGENNPVCAYVSETTNYQQVYLVVWGPVLRDSMGAPKYQSLS